MSDRTQSPPPAAPSVGDAPTVTNPVSVGDAATVGAAAPTITLQAPLAPPGYVIERELGRGGMGVVYLARQAGLNRPVALKMILGADSDPKALIRFLAEAEAIAAIRHPNVVQVYQYGDAAGRPFLALEYLAGGSLGERLTADVRPSPEEAAHTLAQVADGVQAAHALGIVHRDLKPANILLDDAGTPKVTDFGLAKRDAGIDLTNTNSIMGTPAYMSPEQAKGETKFVGPEADVWALGVILYEVLAGRRPFDGPNAWSLLKSVMEHTPPSVRSLSAGVPRDLGLICEKCLSKEKADRYPTAGAVAADLRRFLAGEPISARPVPVPVRAWKWARRNRKLAAALATAAAALVIGTAVSVGFALHARDQATEAEKARAAAVAERDAAVKARARTREALDAMTSTATGDTLTTQTALSPEQRKFLTGVLTYYREFAGEQGDDEPSRRRTADAAARVGHIESRLGRKAEAVAALELARGGFASLAADFPAEPYYRDALAATHTNLALQLDAIRRGPDAVSHAEQAVALRQHLASDFPDVTEYRYKVALAHDNLGLMRRNHGRKPQAEEHYGKGRVILDGLAAEYPDVAEYRNERAVCLTALGNLLLDRRDPVGEELLRAALGIREKLVADFADVPDFRRVLARSHNNLGRALEGRGRRAEAEEQYRLGLAVIEKLVGEYPGVPEYRSGLGTAYTALGVLFDRAGRMPEAEAEYRRALAVCERLAAESPGVPEYQSELAGSHNNLGNLLLKLGRPDAAEPHYRQSLAIRQRLADADPTATEPRVLLGGGYCNFALRVRDGGRPGDSLEWFDKAVRTLTAVCEREPRHNTARLFLRNSHWGRAWAYERLNRFAEAVPDYDRAVELSPEAERPGIRAGRASARVRAGQVSGAVAEVVELTASGRWAAEEWYEFARVCAIAAPRSGAEGPAHADRAMEMLRKAVAGGFRNRAALENDPELAAIRGRADFRELVESLPRKLDGAPPPRPAR